MRMSQQPVSEMTVIPPVYRKGDTSPAGTDGKFKAGIDVDDWFQRIVVYGHDAADAEKLRDLILETLQKDQELAAEEAERALFESWIYGREGTTDMRLALKSWDPQKRCYCGAMGSPGWLLQVAWKSWKARAQTAAKA